jgi:hypothetical protein
MRASRCSVWQDDLQKLDGVLQGLRSKEYDILSWCSLVWTSSLYTSLQGIFCFERVGGVMLLGGVLSGILFGLVYLAFRLFRCRPKCPVGIEPPFPYLYSHRILPTP